jgi:hypothetical protein
MSAYKAAVRTKVQLAIQGLSVDWPNGSLMPAFVAACEPDFQNGINITDLVSCQWYGQAETGAALINVYLRNRGTSGLSAALRNHVDNLSAAVPEGPREIVENLAKTNTLVDFLAGFAAFWQATMESDYKLSGPVTVTTIRRGMDTGSEWSKQFISVTPPAKEPAVSIGTDVQGETWKIVIPAGTWRMAQPVPQEWVLPVGSTFSVDKQTMTLTLLPQRDPAPDYMGVTSQAYGRDGKMTVAMPAIVLEELVLPTVAKKPFGNFNESKIETKRIGETTTASASPRELYPNFKSTDNQHGQDPNAILWTAFRVDRGDASTKLCEWANACGWPELLIQKQPLSLLTIGGLLLREETGPKVIVTSVPAPALIAGPFCDLSARVP